MKEFQKLKNGGIFKIKNDSEHNHLSNFLTILNLAGYKKAKSFTFCTLPSTDNAAMTVKEFLLQNTSSQSDIALSHFFKNRNAQKLFELINFRLDEQMPLNLLTKSDLNMLCLIKALTGPVDKPIMIHFEQDCIFAQNAINRIYSFMEDCIKNKSMSIFISGYFPQVFESSFLYNISRAQDSKFNLTENREQEHKNNTDEVIAKMSA